MNKKNILIAILVFLNIGLIIKQTVLMTNDSNSIIYANSNIEEKRVSNTFENHKYHIDIYYPVSNYQTLNNEVMKIINNYLNEFKQFVSDKDIQPNQYYTLNILYNKYEYSNYISYIFRISEYTGGAHPNNILSTIVYNKDCDKIVTIKELVKDNQSLLDILSTESRKILESNPIFKDNIIREMLLNGTEPKLDNFKNFVFSKDGIIIFFEQYQIAPYSYGEFNVNIPYSKIGIKKSIPNPN